MVDQRRKMRLGILGGGQLARMIAQAALRDGLQPVVLAGSRDEPAAIEGVWWVDGSHNDRDALDQLFSRADIVTIENEFIDVPLMREVLRDHPDVTLAPGLESIAVSQDKLAQKKLFSRLGLATPAYETVDTSALPQELPRLRRRFPEGFVLKFARFGYDGRGNLPVQPGAPTDEADIARFCRAAEVAGSAVYAEQLIDFSAELAMVATRTSEGRHQCFPLVESVQEHGICREVAGPAVRLGTAPWLAWQASEAITRIADTLAFCGTLAVEFFLTRDGQLLINEMAPRVHNSGHYTLYRDEPSQFDLHVGAVTGAGLPVPAIDDLAAMRNILGPQGIVPGLPCPAPTLAPPAGVELHWYGKRTVSAGRKMGHLTGRASTIAELKQLLSVMRDYEKRLWAAFANMQQAG